MDELYCKTNTNFCIFQPFSLCLSQMAFICTYSCHFIVVKQHYTPMQQSPWWWDFSEMSGSKSLQIHSLQPSGKYCKKLPRTCWTSLGKWKKESFSWWIKLHVFYVEVSWEFHLGIRDCHPSAGEMLCVLPWGNQSLCPAVWRYQGRKQD